MAPALRLDHAVINVRDHMDAAQALFAGLGFEVTARGYHSLGSINHLTIFATDYLELLGVPSGADPVRREIAEAPLGINGLVFKTTDADATFARLAAIDMDGAAPNSFSRPVELADGARHARFRTVHVRPGTFPGGRVYFCEHQTPDLVWRAEWQSHANGAAAITELVVVSSTPAEQAARFAALLDAEVEDDRVAFDGGVITVLAPDAYEGRYGDLACALGDRGSIFGAIVLATTDPAAAAGRLESAARAGPGTVDVRTGADGCLVRLSRLNALLEFVPTA